MLKNFKEFLKEENEEELTPDQLAQFPELLKYRVSFAKANGQKFDASRLVPDLYTYNKLLGFLRSKADVTTGNPNPSAISLYSKIMGDTVRQNGIDFDIETLKNKDKIVKAFKKSGIFKSDLTDENLSIVIKLFSKVAAKADPKVPFGPIEFFKNLEDSSYIKDNFEAVKNLIKDAESNFKTSLKANDTNYQSALDKVDQKNKTDKIKTKALNQIKDKLDHHHTENKDQLNKSLNLLKSVKQIIK